ncbi:hypothetical protein AC1031_015130 [Aphanomyces cochlioides]|nr:hypothetical protein AC1031_015130 [Aphanomyces cochlioides]
MTKAELLEVVKQRRGPPKYATQLIATTHGHTLYFTPPYHPELQPIELIWGAVKNKIARRPSKNISDLIARLQGCFDVVTREQWMSSYRFEDMYIAGAEDAVLAEEDLESDCGEDHELNGLLDGLDNSES